MTDLPVPVERLKQAQSSIANIGLAYITASVFISMGPAWGVMAAGLHLIILSSAIYDTVKDYEKVDHPHNSSGKETEQHATHERTDDSGGDTP